MPIIGPRTHAFWLGSSVFDGARAFEGVTPDLDRHCARVNASARTLGLEPTVDVETMIGLTREGMKRFAPDAALYIRPMYWAEAGRLSCRCRPIPASTRFLLTLYETPMPPPTGFSVTRLALPPADAWNRMPTDAKAGCLYPNNGRAIMEARARGFDNALVRDMLGNVAETGTSNVFMVKDGVVLTPAAEPLVPRTASRGSASIAAAARGGRRGARDGAHRRRLPRRRRDFFHRQLLQGGADHPHRGPRAAAGADPGAGAGALLGMGAQLKQEAIGCSPLLSFGVYGITP